MVKYAFLPQVFTQVTVERRFRGLLVPGDDYDCFKMDVSVLAMLFIQHACAAKFGKFGVLCLYRQSR